HVLVVARRPVPEALAVDAGGEVEDGVVGRDEGGGGGLDAGRRLDLQDQRRVLDLERGGALAGHVLVELLEPRVEVVLHRARHGAQDARIGRDWSRGQGDDRFLDLGCHGCEPPQRFSCSCFGSSIIDSGPKKWKQYPQWGGIGPAGMTSGSDHWFDILVIGSGTAGSVLAARLSEDAGVSVGLVEA